VRPVATTAKKPARCRATEPRANRRAGEARHDKLTARCPPGSKDRWLGRCHGRVGVGRSLSGVELVALALVEATTKKKGGAVGEAPIEGSSSW